MSAFIVGDAHITYLLNAGLELAARRPATRLCWLVRDLTEEEKAEAYQEGSPWGPGALEVYGRLKRELTEENAGWVGAMLLAENAKSVNFRYGEQEWEQPYVFERIRLRVDPVVVLSAIACYEYQSCEHPGWKDSEASNFCESLRRMAIWALPGYGQAPYEITREYLLLTRQ